jgi:small subunit ribosomal protein S12
MGEFAARNMIKKRSKLRWSAKAGKKKLRKLWKKDPLQGAPMGRGIVLKKKGVEQKQPHSGIIKCVRVQIIKNGIQVTAFVPGTNSIRFIDEHDEVTIVGVGGSQKSAVGSMHGIKYKVIGVNGASLNELLKGKKEKPKTA